MELRGLVAGMWAVGINYYDYTDIYDKSVQDQQLVIVRHMRFENSEIEMTIKEAHLFKDRIELVPRSRNRKYRSLIIPTEPAATSNQDETVEIAAIVGWAGWNFI